jgi:hypothetical protein
MRQKRTYGFAHVPTNDPLYLDVAEITFTDRRTSATRTFNATAFPNHPILAKAFLSALYRHSYTQSFASLGTRWQNLNVFFHFLVAEDVSDNLESINEDLFDRYLPWLHQYRGRTGTRRVATKTVYNNYKLAERLAQEALRVRGRALRKRRNPVPGIGRAAMPKEHREPQGFIRLLACAKQDVHEVWQQWSERDNMDLTTPLGRSVKYFQDNHAGIVVPQFTSTISKGHSKLHWDLQQCGGVEVVARRLHATMDSLTPFLLLVSYYTAANVQALETFTRNCMSPDPLLERTMRISWWKGRTTYEQTATRTDNGFFSAPSLIRMVLELTSPLLPHVPPHDANRLFLVRADGKHGKLAAASYQMWYTAVKRFIKRHGIQDLEGVPLYFRRDMIRPTVLTTILRETKSPIATMHVANHRNLQTTWQYVVEPLTDELLDATIASAQMSMLNTLKNSPPAKTSKPGARRTVSYGKAKGRSNDCSDPTNGPGGTKPGELCPAWLYPFNDPSLIIPPEPKYVAEVLRHRDSLLAIRKVTQKAKFEMVYLPALSIIENRILPRMPKEILREAQNLLATLPPLPLFADE